MRDREVIEREMYKAREDLEQSLAELKQVVAAKVDVKARARVAVAKGKMAAQDALENGKAVAVDALQRGKMASRDLAIRGRDGAVDAFNAAKDRPVLVAGIVGGIVALGVLAYVGRQKQWW
jgi:hypothetical protein